MANPEHLDILRKGVEAWNKWREENPDIEPDLSGGNLKRADLSGANLRRARLKEGELTRADLSGANLSRANLIRAQLLGANLSGADLSGANLRQVQMLKTNLETTTLTGACIEDWNINSETHLKNIKCDYIFLNSIWNKQEQKYRFTERRPHQEYKIFEAGDFEKLVIKSQETIDLIFRNGIDWQAFLNSYEQLKVEAGIEYKDKEVSIYREQLQETRYEHSQLLLGMFKTMAEQQGSPKYNINSLQVGGSWADQNEVSQTRGQIINNYAPEQKQSLAEAATEIQQLLDQLSQTYSPEEAERKVAEDLANKAKQDPSFKEKLKNWSLSLANKGAEVGIGEIAKKTIQMAITLLV